MKDVNDHLDAHWELTKPKESQTIQIPTGIFIQSLKFISSSEVGITGYIWQRYSADLECNVKPCGDEIGFVLPEQVDTSSRPTEAYRHTDRNTREETIGWYIEATLKQPFEYDTYPFDHKTVWVRLWSSHFNENIVLVPDFSAYPGGTDVHDHFGIEGSIVLGAWTLNDTFFNYKSYDYTSNFGIPYIGEKGFPELHYNFVINRRVENAMIIHLLPIALVAALLFGALLTFTKDPELSNRHGFSTSGVIAASSALFFVVLLAHVQLREQFSSSGVVYMEYLYFF